MDITKITKNIFQAARFKSVLLHKTFAFLRNLFIVQCHCSVVTRFCFIRMVTSHGGGLASSSNPDSESGGSIATSRVSQDGQINRAGTTKREMHKGR